MNNHTINPQQLLAEFDAQVAINIRNAGALWTVETLNTAFTRQGLVRREGGGWIMPDGEDGILFSVLSAPLPPWPAARLMLILPVPCVSSDKNAFGIMTTCARELASELGGTLVDDGNQPLSDAALKNIENQVAEFQKDMEASGLVPGSILARRLFSQSRMTANGGSEGA